MYTNIYYTLSTAGEFTKRIALRDDESASKEPEPVLGDIQDENCQCSKNAKPTPRFTSGREAEQLEAIEFENALQNMVRKQYIMIIP